MQCLSLAATASSEFHPNMAFLFFPDASAGFGSRPFTAATASRNPIRSGNDNNEDADDDARSSVSNPYIHISSCYSGRGRPQQQQQPQQEPPPTQPRSSSNFNHSDVSDGAMGDDSVFLPASEDEAAKQLPQVPSRPPKQKQQTGEHTLLIIGS